MSEPIPEPRTHIYLPQLDAQGNLFRYAHVTVQKDNRTYLGMLYYDQDGEDLAQNPLTVQPGILDLWADEPMRVNIDVSTDNTAHRLEGVDFFPHPVEVVRVPRTMLIEAEESPTHFMTLQGTDSDDAEWVIFDPLVSQVHHDGSSESSTTLSPGATWKDDAASQTWLGYLSGSAGKTLNGSTALGPFTRVNGLDQTLVGNDTQNPYMHEFVTAPDGAVVVGSGTIGGLRSVLVSSWSTVVASQSVSIGHDLEDLPEDTTSVVYIGSQNQIPGGMHDNTVVIGTGDYLSAGGGYRASNPLGAGGVLLGVAHPPPAPLGGDPETLPSVGIGKRQDLPLEARDGMVSEEIPLVLYGDETQVPGPLEAQNVARVGGAAGTVGFFGVPGIAKATITDNAMDAGVTELLNALQSLGLLTKA